MRALIVTIAICPLAAMAGWNEIELPEVEHYQVSVGDKRVRVGDSVLFWTKENYVANAVGDADIDYGSKVTRYMADCDSLSFSIIHESTYEDFKGRGKAVKVSNTPTATDIAGANTIHELVINTACDTKVEPQVTIADLAPETGITAFGQCFPDRAHLKAFTSMLSDKNTVVNGVI